MSDAAKQPAASHGDPRLGLVERFHEVLVESIQDKAPSYLSDRFTVAEIYQFLVPYRTYRDRLGFSMSGDYEDTLLRLLAGEGGFVVLESGPALERIRKELEGLNPNTGMYREFAAAEVRLRSGAPSERRAVVRVAEEDGGQRATSPSEPVRASTRGSRGAGGDSGASVSGSPCPECEKPLPVRESVRFCPFCGTDTRNVPCSSCGEILDREWSYCVACGTLAKS